MQKKPKRNARHSAFLVRLLAQIEAESSDAVITVPAHACGGDDAPLIASLIKGGLLAKRQAEYVDCIACAGTATVERNQRGLLAVCGCCGEVFSITQRDTLEYTTGLLPLDGTDKARRDRGREMGYGQLAMAARRRGALLYRLRG
jgi:hypothetical protein